MLKENYRILKSLLVGLNYSFNREDNSPIADLSFTDKVTIKSFEKKQIILDVERLLEFKPLENTKIYVCYEVVVEPTKDISKEEFIEEIKKTKSPLLGVFADISLQISLVTNAGPFGTLITPPTYDGKKIQIN